MEQFGKLDKMEKTNDANKLRTFFNKIETTIHNLRSVGIKTSSYPSRHLPVQS